MSKAYISGPITGKTHQEVTTSFSRAAQIYRLMGYLVISPINMDIMFDGEVNETPSPADRRKFARRDTHVLVNEMKAEDGDIIVALQGWEKSKGARAEIAIGLWIGLAVEEMKYAAKQSSL